MPDPFSISATLETPAVRAGAEPEEPLAASIRIRPDPAQAQRPLLDLCFVIDASASMHHFSLSPDQRAYWLQRAEGRGEVTRQRADGRTGLIWTGETLRELQRHVSTPMLSSLRGIWKNLEQLTANDRVSILAFADRSAALYEDSGLQPAARLETARRALATLGGGVDQSGLGRGTRLAGAIGHAVDRLVAPSPDARMRRIILISDGIIEDGEECLPHLDRAAEHGLVISVIGVGDDFDEEHLMRIADQSRGNYFYAATAPEAEQALARELEQITSIVARDLKLDLAPAAGSILQDLFSVRPAMSEFRTMWVQDGRWCFKLGDLPAGEPVDLMLYLAPPSASEGQLEIANVCVRARGSQDDQEIVAQCPVQLYYSTDERLLTAVDEEVSDASRRLRIFLEERRAAAALAVGDAESATRHLRAATRMLRNLGDEELAAEMEQAAGDSETGTRSLSRTKKLKAGTRKLGQRTDDSGDPSATRVSQPSGTRSLGGRPGE